jgi:MFS family permease
LFFRQGHCPAASTGANLVGMTFLPLRARPAPAPSPELGIGIGLGAATVVVAGLLAAAVPVADQPWRFAVMVIAVVVFGALFGGRLAVACAAGLAWLVVNGFLVDRFGELSWHGTADIYRALMLISAGVLGLLIAAMRRRRRGV